MPPAVPRSGASRAQGPGQLGQTLDPQVALVPAQGGDDRARGDPGADARSGVIHAAAGLDDPRMIFTISSRFETAITRPSRMCARSRAFESAWRTSRSSSVRWKVTAITDPD